MSTDGIRRAVDEMAEAARRLDVPPDDDMAFLLKSLAKLGEEITTFGNGLAEIVRELRAEVAELRGAKPLDLDQAMQDALLRASKYVVFNTRSRVERLIAVRIAAWMFGAAVGGATVMWVGLWIGGLLQ